jgi:transposase-like protein
MKCARCGESRAAHRWELRLCADDRRKRSKWLCNGCDTELNGMVLTYFGDPRAAVKLERYKGGGS